MNFSGNISINNNIVTISGLKDIDAWSLNVINANFMLDKYNGRGNVTINIISFSNLGDGLYGEIEFYVNNYQCFKSSVSNVSGEGSSFSVTPKYITLNGSGSIGFVNVSSNCDWTNTTNSNFSVEKETSGLKITSTSNNLFENEEIIVKNCNGLTETVYVSQKEIYTSDNVLEVNPQYIELSGDNKEFTINVVSICSGNTTYKVNNEEYTSKSITSSITATNDAKYTLTVSNGCDSKDVTIVYKKQNDSDKYLWISTSGTSSVTYTFTADTSVSYDILSSSNWYIYSYDSSKVRCSKNGNKITVSLGSDKNETNDKEIIIKNRDNCEPVKIIYSIGSGLVSESGVTFTFESGLTEYTVSTITQTSSNDDIEFDICVFAYDSDKNAVEWRVKSSSFSATTSDLVGGVDTCKTVRLKATESTKKSKMQSYIIKLQEQDTYQEISVKVNINRPQDEVTSQYNIEISPESGIYSKSEMNDFQILVTPSYIYNGNTYYIGDYENMTSGNLNPSYKGVSALTTSNTNGVTLNLVNNDDVYDTLIYNVNISEDVLTNLESFEICASAITQTTDKTFMDEVACTTITLTASTVEIDCDFSTGSTNLEVGGEAQTVEEVLYSKINGEKVNIITSCTSDDCSWFSIEQDEYGEVIFITFEENPSFDDRTAQVKVTQEGGECEGEYIINILQYSSQVVFIPNFDYLVIRYFWEAEAGTDLDTVTVIPYLIKEDGSQYTDTSVYTYIDDGVGFSHGYEITNSDGTLTYIRHAGDNTGDGVECVYIDFKNICSEEQIEEMLTLGVEKIRVDLYGVWYNSKGTGLLDVSLIAYSGGTMSEPSNYNFTNDGGTEVYNDVKNAKVCVQGSGLANTYKNDYNLIGYVEYNIKTTNAMLILNGTCEDSNYVLENLEVTSTVSVNYRASSGNQLMFISTKDNEIFSGITTSEVCTWLEIADIIEDNYPFILIYNVLENTEGTQRSCNITLTQPESNKQLYYTVIQGINTNSFFSFSADTYVSEIHINVGEGETTITVDVYSCINYNEETKTGNIIDYTVSSMSCGTYENKIDVDVYQYTQTFNIPTDCGEGTIILTQNDTDEQLTITFSCECVINSVSISPSGRYDFTDVNETKTLIMSVNTNDCANCTKKTKFIDPNGNVVQIGEDEYTVSLSNDNVITGNYTLISEDNTGKTSTIYLKKYSPCMTINYTVIGFNNTSETIYFKTTNGTQQGSHSVSSSGSQELCNIAENTQLVVSCNNSDVEIEGGSFIYEDGASRSITLRKPCITSNTWNSLSVTGSNMDKCATSSSLTVTASGTHTNTACTTSTTSTTLSSSNYTVTYNPSGKNETDSSRNVTIKVTGSGTYAGLTASTTVTQSAGPCTPTADCVLGESSTATGGTGTTRTLEPNGTTTVTIYSKDEFGRCTTTPSVSSSNESVVTANASALDDSTCSNVWTITAGGTTSSAELTFTNTCTTYVIPIRVETGFEPYCEFLIARYENGVVVGEYTTTITETYEADDNDSHYLNLSTKSRYYTSANDYERVDVTISSDKDWIPVNTSTNSFEVLDNTSTSQRTGTVTFTQNGDHGCNLKCYVNIIQKGAATPDVYVFENNNTPSSNYQNMSSSSGGSSIHITSTKNGSMFSSITTNESCDWISFGNHFSDNSGGYYVMPFNHTANNSESERSCTVTFTQGESNETLSFTITQEGKEPTPSCDCDTVSISCSPRTSVTTGNTVSTNITLNVGDNCDNSWSAYRGSSFVMSGTSSTFSATQLGTVTIKSNACPDKSTTFDIVEPVLTGLKILNNEPGSASIKITIGSNPTSSYTLGTKETQTYTHTFNDNSTVNIEYSGGTWVKGMGSGFVSVNFEGSNLTVDTGYENGILIDYNGEDYWVRGNSDGSCSGSLVTKSGTYTVTVNFIFSGYPYSGNFS